MRLKFLNFSTRNVIRWTQYCARCCTQYRKQCCWTFQLSHRRWIWCWVICHPCQRRLLKGRLWYLPATHNAAHDYERAWCWVICHPCKRRLLKGRLWYLPATHFAAHDYERAMPHTMVSTCANLQQFFSVFNDVPCCKQLIISICNTLSVYLSFSGCTSRWLVPFHTTQVLLAAQHSN